MSSLRRRISVGVIGITSGVVLVAAAGIWTATRSVLIAGVDQDLEQRLERMKRFDGLSVPHGWRHRPPPPPEAGREAKDAAEQRRLHHVYRTADGLELGRSANLPDGERLGLGTGPMTVVLGDGRRVRSRGVELTRPPPFFTASEAPPGEGPVVVRIGHDLEPVDAELARMARMLGALWIAATVLAAIAVLSLRNAILRPMRRLGEAIDRLGPDDLAARVPDTTGPDEVRGMVVRLNGLLGRLEQAFRREQATIASIAHELRTPVAALRSDIEFRLLAGPGADEAAVLCANLKTVERMQAMVGNLLLLARLESGREPLPREPVDLALLLAEAAEGWEVRAAAAGRPLALTAPETAPAMGSALHLRLVVDNLLGNAVAHGDPGAVRVILAGDQVGWSLAVDNPFAGSLDAAQLGEAFYRGDAARSDGDHCGLGLALCRRLARLTGCGLDLVAEDGRFRAVLTLPHA